MGYKLLKPLRERTSCGFNYREQNENGADNSQAAKLLYETETSN